MINCNINEENPFVIQDSASYFIQTGRVDTEDLFWNVFYDKNSQECDLVQQIITTEFSYFLLRRCTGLGYDETVDACMELRRKLINEYKDKYKTVFIELNTLS